MNKTVITLAVLAVMSNAAFAAQDIAVTGNSNTTQTPDASLDKANHSANDNVSTVNGTTIDPNIVNQYTDSSNRSASATGGTYTTGALTAAGGQNGDQTATTGASTATNGNQTATNTTGASTAKVGNTSATNGNVVDKSTTSNITKSAGGEARNSDHSTRNQSTSIGDTGLSSKQATNAKTGNSTTNVDASDRSTTNYRSLALVHPTIPAAPATQLAVGNIAQQVGVCSPLMSVQRDKVTGTYQGLIFKTKLDQGHDDQIVSYDGDQLFKVVTLSNGRVVLMGHQPVISTSIISLGGARNIGLNGGGQGGGSYGGAGMGSSSQAQRLVTNVQLVPCVYGEYEPRMVLNIKG